MRKTHEENSEVLSLVLKTPDSAANAAAVASMLNAIVVLIEETQSELKIDGEFSIRVNPFKEGSLEIPLQVFVTGGLVALFTFNPDLAKVIDTLKSVFDLKKYFKGEAPNEKTVQKGVSVGEITINGGTNVINIINQPRVELAFDRAAQDLEKDVSLTGMKVINRTTGEEIADIPREEFKYFRASGSEQSIDTPQDRNRPAIATLTIHSPVLQGNAKWKFVYEGKQISASIKDETFLEEVASGAESFRNGDRLIVELEIGEKYVAAILDYERTNQYSIKKVVKHIPRPTPPKLPMGLDGTDSE
ncbi:MAG: hypothetical protein H6824_20025 [Planctomycetaceae bacterium]|nr:hypothetical protein [Planctomycetaceae bacterium]